MECRLNTLYPYWDLKTNKEKHVSNSGDLV